MLLRIVTTAYHIQSLIIHVCSSVKNKTLHSPTWNNITIEPSPPINYITCSSSNDRTNLHQRKLTWHLKHRHLEKETFLFKNNSLYVPHLKHREQPYAPCIPAGLGVVLKRQLRGTDLCGQGKFARGHGAWSNAWSFEPTLRWWTNGVEMEKN